MPLSNTARIYDKLLNIIASVREEGLSSPEMTSKMQSICQPSRIRVCGSSAPCLLPKSTSSPLPLDPFVRTVQGRKKTSKGMGLPAHNSNADNPHPAHSRECFVGGAVLAFFVTQLQMTTTFLQPQHHHNFFDPSRCPNSAVAADILSPSQQQSCLRTS